MTRAASKLHVTTATLSVQIRELEKSICSQLLKKSGRGIALTEMGETVYRYATDIFALGEELKGAVKGHPLGTPLLLRVGVKDAMPKRVAFRFIQRGLCLQQPIKLICREGEVDRLVSELMVHRLDVILSDTPLDPSLKVRAYSHLLGESTISLVAVKSLAEQYRPQFPESLQGAPLLLPTTDTVLRRSMDQWFSENEITPNIKAELEDSAMIQIAGQSGVGIFATPTWIRDEVCEMYRVETVGELPITERFYALSVERKIKHPAVAAITQSPLA